MNFIDRLKNCEHCANKTPALKKNKKNAQTVVFIDLKHVYNLAQFIDLSSDYKFKAAIFLTNTFLKPFKDFENGQILNNFATTKVP